MPVTLLTIDAQLQATLKRLAHDAVLGRGDRLLVPMVVADHRTGAILASVGAAARGNTKRQSFVDMTRAVRSPGSAPKPFVQALAFNDGLTV